MLVGIPNVGKSAFANSLHQVGGISAAEKGKLKHATVSPHPGETKNITSLKIASNPNIYILDTPGILPPKILDDELCSKLALTGAIADSLVDQSELAKYFLPILNLSDEHKKWEKFSTMEDERENQIMSDHTQVPKQPGNTECGYYVCKFMKEIIDVGLDVLVTQTVGDGKPVYTDADLDEIREDWADFVSNFILDHA